MLLAIDIGNTNTVFGVFDDSDLIQTGRMETGAFSDLQNLENISGVIISSVVPSVNDDIAKDLDHEPIWVTKDIIDMPIDIDRPEDVGADRLVNAVAVLEHYESPAIIVDFGTATTFDVLDIQGHYIGGVIAPGINLSLEALHQAAAQLPEVGVEKPARVIGKDTVSAMQSGIYWGYIGLIEGIVDNISDEMGETPFILATGGLAPLFASSTPVINQVDEDLTLKGLLSIYQHIQ